MTTTRKFRLTRQVLFCYIVPINILSWFSGLLTVLNWSITDCKCSVILFRIDWYAFHALEVLTSQRRTLRIVHSGSQFRLTDSLLLFLGQFGSFDQEEMHGAHHIPPLLQARRLERWSFVYTLCRTRLDCRSAQCRRRTIHPLLYRVQYDGLRLDYVWDLWSTHDLKRSELPASSTVAPRLRLT